MKKLILLAFVLCSAATMLAQNNRMSYQAVVRNAANELVYDENVTVRIEILDALGTVQYAEQHATVTNANGMLSLTIGEGGSVTGDLSAVVWQNAVIRSVFTLPGGATVTQNTPVTAVPYAIYADHAANVPTSVSAFTNDANYITAADIPAETDPTVPTWAKEANKPAYDYSEIGNTPTIPTVPTNVSAFTNDANYITAADIPAETDPTVPAWAKEANKPAYDYSEIENTPTIPTVPTNVSAFTNDANYITAADIPAIPNNVSTFNNDANYITNSNTSCSNTVDLCELLQKIGQLENQLEMLENQLEPIMVLTQGITTVTQTSFTVNGKVQTDGSTTISQRGFVYSSSNPNPTLSDNHVTNGSGNGTFTSTISGLTAGITYHVRAYATNENGTFYGSEVAVTTTATSPSTVPSVTTIAATNITTSEATVTGEVTSDGGETVSQRGFAYDTLPNPTTSSSVTYHGTGTGQFSNLLNGLRSGKTYYVRAFATNSVGTAYGNQITFATSVPTPVAGDAIPCPGTPTVTDHEGNVYNTVQIGTQCWTKENMRATTSPSTGTYLIPPAGTESTHSGKQARWFNNDSATYAPKNCGLLYNWNAAVDTFNTIYGETSVNPNFYAGSIGVDVEFTGHRRGICPQGWHIPSNNEWDTLTDYLNSHEEYRSGGLGAVAKALASTTDWYAHTWEDSPYCPGNNLTENNLSGFTAIPTGVYGSVYNDFTRVTVFWSSNQFYGYEGALHCGLAAWDANVLRDFSTKDSYLSVRCLRD